MEKYKIEFDPFIPELLFENNFSLVFSTYQAGRLMIIGSLDGEMLHQIPVAFKKPMGIAVDGQKLAVAGLEELLFFSNNEQVEKTVKLNAKNFDTIFVQRAAYNTSTLDIHDIQFGDGVLWGVNTLFSTICTFDINYSFRPKWKPPFIDALVPEDRCHLNGMTLVHGLPKYVTALSSTNHKEGWRDDIMNSGCLMEVPSGDVILDHLSMPHSPRMIDGELFVLESGKGLLLKVNPEEKTYEIVENFGKFVRGMSHSNGILMIGMSKIRETSKTFNGLDVKENSQHAGVLFYDLKQRKMLGEIRYTSDVEEIYDVQVIEGYKKPAILNSLSKEYKEIIVFPNNVYWRKGKKKAE